MNARNWRPLAARVFAIAASFAQTVVVARLLAPDESGRFFIVFTTIAIGATLGRFGVDTLALKLLGGAGDARAALPAAWATAAAASVLSGVAVVVVAGLPVIGGDLGVPALVAVGFGTIGFSLSVIAGSVLRGTGRMVAGIFAELASVPVIVIAFLLTLHLMSKPLDADAALVVTGFAMVVTAGWSVPLSVRAVRRTVESSSPSQGWAAFARTNGRSLALIMLTAMIAFAVVWAPSYALTAMGNFSGVTEFTIALRMASVLTLVPSVQIAVLAPQFSKMFYSRELGRLNALARHSTRTACALVVLPALVLLIWAEPIVALVFGADMTAAVGPLRLLAVAAMVSVAAGQVNQLMLLCGLESLALGLNVGIVIVWVAIGMWVATLAGVVGVAGLSAVLTMLYCVIAWVALRARRGISSGVW